MDTERKARRARRELRSYRGRTPRRGMSDEMRLWHEKYTGLVIDFMCSELCDERLAEWRIVFTGLYELTGAGFSHFCAKNVITEDQAWARVDPWIHILHCRVFSLNPMDVDPLDFLAEYIDFFDYLARHGAISKAVRDTLTTRFETLRLDAAA